MILLVLVLAIKGLSDAATVTWDPSPEAADGDTAYACLGRDVTVLTSGVGDDVSVSSLVLEKGAEVVAVVQAGELTVSDGYEGRVKYEVSAGLSLKSLTSEDGGTYTLTATLTPIDVTLENGVDDVTAENITSANVTLDATEGNVTAGNVTTSDVDASFNVTSDDELDVTSNATTVDVTTDDGDKENVTSVLDADFRNVTSENVTSEEVTSSDATLKDTSEEVTTEDVASEDVTSSDDVTPEDVTSEEVSSEDVTTEDVTSDDVTTENNTLRKRDLTSANVTTISSSLTVRVLDGLPVEDGLQVALAESPVHVANTDTWHVVLTCGKFTLPHPPPFTVTWSTPRGLVESTDFKDGYFRLMVANPVMRGAYRCLLLPPHPPALCLDDDKEVQRQITLNQVEARLMILEAENQHLKTSLEKDAMTAADALAALQEMALSGADRQNATLQGLKAVTSRHEALADLAELKNDDLENLGHELGVLQANHGSLTLLAINNDARQDDAVSALSSRLELAAGGLTALESRAAVAKANQTKIGSALHHLSEQHHGLYDTVSDALNVHVSFLATGLKNSRPKDGEKLRLGDVKHNAGSGYDVTSGVFTAPRAGTYVILASFWRQGDAWTWFQVALVVDGTRVVKTVGDSARRGDDDAASLQAVLQLGEGQRVWLQAEGGDTRFGDKDGDGNSFSAVLITPGL